ncbi:MAG: ATP synthase F1 subunit epsilon [Clostridiales bacterium]|nr:ATP synthase F1 subunit epsilon [Clostridiales bacterium]
MADDVQKKKMMLEVVTPYEVFFEGQIEKVVLPAQDGQLGVMPGHSPLVVAITPGIASFEVDGETKDFVMSEGFAEIAHYVVVVVCNAAEWPEQIDENRARSALERAEQKFNKSSTTEEQRLYARHAMRRAKARLKLVSEHKKDKNHRFME